MANPTTFGTTFFYGIKSAQLTGLVLESFGYEKESRLKTELEDENGKLVGLRFDDNLEKLTISAVLTGAMPEPNTVITFAALSGESASPGGVASKKFRITKVKLDGKNNDKLKVSLDCEANEYITLA